MKEEADELSEWNEMRAKLDDVLARLGEASDFDPRVLMPFVVTMDGMIDAMKAMPPELYASDTFPWGYLWASCKEALGCMYGGMSVLLSAEIGHESGEDAGKLTAAWVDGKAEGE